MALEVYWTKAAEEKFSDIIDYLHKRWGDSSVRSFVRKAFGTIGIVAEFPELGVLEYSSTLRSFLIVKQITLIYRVDGNRLIIVTFFDNRQNPLRRHRYRNRK